MFYIADGMQEMNSRTFSQSPTVYQKTNSKYQAESTTAIYSTPAPNVMSLPMWREAESGAPAGGRSLTVRNGKIKKPKKQTGLVSVWRLA